MVDDLVTKGTAEPYRMFTSRAEFRLNLRIDNSDKRLTPIGKKAGLVGEKHWEQFLLRQARLDRLQTELSQVKPDSNHPFFVSRGIDLRDKPSVTVLLRRPEIRLEDLLNAGLVSFQGEAVRREDMVSIETAIKYEGYLRQQDREVEKLRKAEGKRIPADLDYAGMPGLSREIVEKLSQVRPASIAQASRIPGITPAAISILLFHIEMRHLSGRPESVA
jgi:tRNA uridine 5-carboxymethylaminomethyl modification enzyme